MPKELAAKLAKLRLRRAMLLAAIVQDFADGLLALNDIAGKPSALLLLQLLTVGCDLHA